MSDFFIPDEFKSTLHYRKVDPADGKTKLICPEGCEVDHSEDPKTVFDDFEAGILRGVKMTWINARAKKKKDD
jgi:hypothetical protein